MKIDNVYLGNFGLKYEVWKEVQNFTLFNSHFEKDKVTYFENTIVQ